MSEFSGGQVAAVADGFKGRRDGLSVFCFQCLTREREPRGTIIGGRAFSLRRDLLKRDSRRSVQLARIPINRKSA